jgi:hypothetical protein
MLMVIILALLDTFARFSNLYKTLRNTFRSRSASFIDIQKGGQTNGNQPNTQQE